MSTVGDLLINSKIVECRCRDFITIHPPLSSFYYLLAILYDRASLRRYVVKRPRVVYDVETQ